MGRNVCESCIQIHQFSFLKAIQLVLTITSSWLNSNFWGNTSTIVCQYISSLSVSDMVGYKSLCKDIT